MKLIFGILLYFPLQMAQELGISEKSPDYRNPFKTDHSEVRACYHILLFLTT